MDEYLGMIKLFAGNFEPRGWAFCNGQIISIAQNTALFSLLGTTYGGNGQTTFALPDLRGRLAVGFGQGPGLSPYVLGQVSGVESFTMTINNMPAHTHQIAGTVSMPVNDSNADAEGPIDAYLGTPSNSIYSSTSSPNVFMAPANIQATAQVVGNNIPFPIVQPVLGLSYIICLSGLYPSRN